MKSGASRVLGLLAVGVLIPACNLTFTGAGDPSSTPAPQDPFTLTKPLIGQTGVWPTNTQFAWGAEPGAISYTFDLSLTSDFSQIIYTQSNISFAWLFLTVNLTHGTTYYWRVSTDVSGITVYAAGSGASFTTVVPAFGPPVAFVLQSPLGTGVPLGTNPVFLWGYAQEATSYAFQIDTDSTFSNPIVNLPDLRITQAVCTVPLVAGSYCWRVIASNSGGQRPSTPTYSTFTVVP